MTKIAKGSKVFAVTVDHTGYAHIDALTIQSWGAKMGTATQGHENTDRNAMQRFYTKDAGADVVIQFNGAMVFNGCNSFYTESLIEAESVAYDRALRAIIHQNEGFQRFIENPRTSTDVEHFTAKLNAARTEPKIVTRFM